MRSLELFAGAGGLAMGVAEAGFRHDSVFEWDRDSCEALRANISRPDWSFDQWRVVEGDVSAQSFERFRGKIDLVAGGPPCQPFSIGGKHKAFRDARDMFPEAARAVSEVRPKAFIFENVRGLTRESFKNYFQYIVLRLSFPEETVGVKESWTDHLARLERLYTSGSYSGLRYRVLSQVLNAADYGIPQKRYRVFIVGFRSDIKQEWNFPTQTHCEDSLLLSKWVDGDYWDEHSVRLKDRPSITAYEESRIGRMTIPLKARWRTVRDAIGGLPDPESKRAIAYQGHRFQPGAKPYAGHTGSQLDNPAKTLKAGDHGVPGGENMLAYEDGRYRYFTIRESARLQTFPDNYRFPTSWTESMRQIGNAVPVTLARVVASSVRSALNKNTNPNKRT